MRSAPIVLAFLLAATATPALGEDERPPLSEKLNKDHAGYGLYQQYCAVCHGVFADGNGLVVPVLTQKPTNLRRLSERYGTPLPKPKLVRTIDGSEPIIAHGSREMPVWGTRLYEDLPSRMPNSRERGAILTLLDYLESIQD